MWAMTLLYLGRHPPKEFEKDYHLTPLIAPDDILAKFPPVLLQCGARDPLVDDTLLFANRVCTAKRKDASVRANAKRLAKAEQIRERQLQRQKAKEGHDASRHLIQLPTPLDDGSEPLLQFGGGATSARPRERSSSASSSSGSTAWDDASEAETNKADDVTVQIFPGWSHGYLQMMPLMSNARVAVEDIADWIMASFDRDTR